MSYWTNALKSGALTVGAVTDFFAASPEFAQRYGSLGDAQFVERLYLNVLDRSGDAEGTAFWTGVLANGSYDRGDVLLGFSESGENKTKTLATMADGILVA